MDDFDYLYNILMQSWHLSPKHPYLHLHVPSKWLQVPPFKHVSSLQPMQFILQSLNVDEYSKQLLLWTMVRALCVLFIGYTFILSFSSWIHSFGMPFARQHAVKQSSILTEVRIFRWISLFEYYNYIGNTSLILSYPICYRLGYVEGVSDQLAVGFLQIL